MMNAHPGAGGAKTLQEAKEAACAMLLPFLSDGAISARSALQEAIDTVCARYDAQRDSFLTPVQRHIIIESIIAQKTSQHQSSGDEIADMVSEGYYGYNDATDTVLLERALDPDFSQSILALPYRCWSRETEVALRGLLTLPQAAQWLDKEGNSGDPVRMELEELIENVMSKEGPTVQALTKESLKVETDYYGFIQCNESEGTLLRSLGATLGDWDDSRRGFYASVPAENLAALQQFPADFKLDLLQFLDTGVRPDEELTVEELQGEIAFQRFWLHSDIRREYEQCKPSKVTDMEVYLYQNMQELASRGNNLHTELGLAAQDIPAP